MLRKMNIFLVVLIVFCVSFTSCSKILADGFRPYELGNVITLEEIYSADEYEPGVITKKEGFNRELFFGELHYDFLKVYFSYEEDIPSIYEVQYFISPNNSKKGMSCLRKYYYQIDREKINSRIVYSFSDKLTSNLVKAEKNSDGSLLIKYISAKQPVNENSVLFKHGSVIEGTNGFLLNMTREEALRKAEKKGLKIVESRQENEILKIWLNPSGTKTYLKSYLKDSMDRLYDDSYIGDENTICLLFLEGENGMYRLASFYQKTFWEWDYKKTFLTPLSDKYELVKVKAQESTSEEKIDYFYQGTQNNNYLQVTVEQVGSVRQKIWDTSSKRRIEKEIPPIILYIKYSISDSEIDTVKRQYVNSREKQKAVKNKSFLDGL